MGSAFEFVFVCQSKEQADHYFKIAVDEIHRLENLLSEFKPDSDISRINAFQKKGLISINEETYQILYRALSISKLSQGYFDITMAPYKSIYQFKNSDFKFPETSAIQRCKSSVGYQYLKCLNNQTIELLKDRMSVSLAAIGKGYAADKAKQLLIQNGLNDGVISASGDLCAWGKNEDGNAWKVGIANPNNKKQNIAFLNLNNMAIATSGDYEQHFIYNNVKYSHNINPLTGYPCTSLKSVSIISPSAELSDALATAVYAMGPEKGISFIDQLPNTFAFIVDEFNQVFTSKNSIFEYED